MDSLNILSEEKNLSLRTPTEGPHPAVSLDPLLVLCFAFSPHLDLDFAVNLDLPSMQCITPNSS